MKNIERIEHDSLGEVLVPKDRYWGAQTQRSLMHFDIDLDRFRWRRPIIKAFGVVKKCAIKANLSLGLLEEEMSAAMLESAEKIISGELDEHFPLGVFQTGSGTHSNMNANEVIANCSNQLLAHPLGGNFPVHPNDHVNLGQSSNDVFPSVMHLAVVDQLQHILLPACETLKKTFEIKSQEFKHIVKNGRTHLQDAVPLTLGQEISAWSAQLDFAMTAICQREKLLHALALGGTAVGTGINAHPEFAQRTVSLLADETSTPWTISKNLFAASSSHEPLVEISSALRTLAVALLKIANDIRWLASGPYGGIGELILPENEPGSSIMPGKINPSQCEALSMVCVQVVGNDLTVAFAGSQGNFQLNAFKPVIVHNILESIRLLSDAMAGFDHYCAKGIQANEKIIQDHLQHNLMLVTALVPHLGYEKAAEVAKHAYKQNMTLQQACLDLSCATKEQYQAWVNLEQMTHKN